MTSTDETTTACQAPPSPFGSLGPVMPSKSEFSELRRSCFLPTPLQLIYYHPCKPACFLWNPRLPSSGSVALRVTNDGPRLLFQPRRILVQRGGILEWATSRQRPPGKPTRLGNSAISHCWQWCQVFCCRGVGLLVKPRLGLRRKRCWRQRDGRWRPQRLARWTSRGPAFASPFIHHGL